MVDYLKSVCIELAEEVAAGDVIPFPLFPIGNWKSAKYPNLPLTRELAEELIANHEAGILGTEPVLDSSGKHDTSSPAAGWFKRLHIEPTVDGGEMLFGDTQLTELGAELLNGGLYRYGSLEIDSVVDNRTGAKTPNVLKSATLTNTPVLRIMPAVLEAGGQIAVALSEITAAEDEDPVQELLTDLEAIATKLDERLKGKKGMPSVRAFMREVRGKVGALKMSDDDSYQSLREDLERTLGSRAYVVDFGDDWLIFERWEEPGDEVGASVFRAAYVRDENGITLGQAVPVQRVTSYVPASDGSPVGSVLTHSLSDSHGAKEEEEPGIKASEGPTAEKGADSTMKSVITALKLAEDADESAVLAEVERIISERDTATMRLAESEKAARLQLCETKVSELVAGGHVAPGQKDAWLKLAEAAPEQFEAMAEAAKTQKVIDLSEQGAPPSQGSDPEGFANASVELAEKAKARAKVDGVSYAAAERLVLSEDTALAERYHDYRMNPAKEA